ncbi:MAG TPA: hypothetical protein VKG86_08285 [Terracidiphilus sp.]|nr:hypothetical protein [Terracidiphilus sp.]
MAINKTGKWWVGSQPQDLKEYLEAFSADGYAINEFRLAKCKCGGIEFSLWADDEEGTAKRVCSSCSEAHFICDSEEYYPDPQPEEWNCVECGSRLANVGVGFSLYEDGEVRWLYLGERCARCGVLGCSAEWKVAYEPSKQLIDQA